MLGSRAPALLLMAALCGCRSTTPSSTMAAPTTITAMPFFDEQAADRWHSERLAALTAEDGWLTLADLVFLEDGVYSLGSEASCRLRYASLTAPRVGAFVVEGNRVTFAVDINQLGHAAAPVTADGRAVDVVELVADDVARPTVLRNGPITITLVRRNGSLALRVKDNASALRRDFRGIERFPFDPRMVVVATVDPAPAGSLVAITNVRGFTTDEPLAATLKGDVAGAPFAFAATKGGGGRFFVVFGDATNGHGTYGGGRFLDIDPPVDGRVTIDFNRAYNPPCSFTAFATCPTPPASNRLAVPISAGEKVPAGH